MRLPLFLLALVGLTFAQLGVYPNYAQGREFHMLNGKTADPCVNREELTPGTKPTCTGRQWPEPAVLVLVATSQSRQSLTSTAVAPAVPTYVLTITGKNLVATATLALATRRGTCATVDLTTTTPITTASVVVAPTTGLTTMPFVVPLSWRTSAMELEHSGRDLCYSTTGAANTFVYTGFKIGAVWDCTADNVASPARGCNSLPSALRQPLPIGAPAILVPGTAGSDTAAIGVGDALTLLSPFEQTMRGLRTKCCIHSVVGTNAVTVPVGQCVNPNLADCCQGAAVDPTSQRCCSTALELVQPYTQPCNCRADSNPNSPTCPTGETCCSLTKYPELTPLYTTSTVTSWPEVFGECYNASTHRCCDTGYRYDPGMEQCCSINGLQSLNVPCPCAVDNDCAGGSNIPNSVGVEGGMYCCRMDWPDPFEFASSVVARSSDKATPYQKCNPYNNYPSTSFPNSNIQLGTAPYQAQKCLGNCIDNRFQSCCNGMACRREFEVCCNSTCCNKYVATCLDGRQAGTVNNRFNYNELDQYYEYCSSIEGLNPLRSFWIFVWPAYLLLMTAVCVAFCIAFTNKVSRRSFSVLERTIIVIALLTIILACACYFAPIYKYGVWITVVSMFAIIVAGARSKTLNLVLVIVQVITLLYLFDPFNGNNYLGFSSMRLPNGDPDPETAGFLYVIRKSFPSLAAFKIRHWCVSYYDYFAKDETIRDFRRDNIAVPSFGYCGDGWLTALYIFEAIALMLVLIQFILAFIAYMLRFKEQRSYEPIELEVRGDNQVPVYPAY